MCRSELLSHASLAILLPLGSLVVLGPLIFASLWKSQGAWGSPANLGQELQVVTAVTPSGFEMLFQPALMRRWQLHDPVESRMLMMKAEADGNYLLASTVQGHGAERMAERGGICTSEQCDKVSLKWCWEVGRGQLCYRLEQQRFASVLLQASAGYSEKKEVLQGSDSL